jgi:HicB family
MKVYNTRTSVPLGFNRWLTRDGMTFTVINGEFKVEHRWLPPNPPVEIKVRMPDQLHQRLKRYAKSRNISVNNLILHALAEVKDTTFPGGSG